MIRIKYANGGIRIMYAVVHAPAGGATVGGKKFTGGEFIPGNVLARATPAEKAALKPGGKSGPAPSPAAKASPGPAPPAGSLPTQVNRAGSLLARVRTAQTHRATKGAPMPPGARVTPADVEAARTAPPIPHPTSDADVARFVAEAQQSPIYRSVTAKIEAIAADSPGGVPTLWSIGKHAGGDILGTLKAHEHEAYGHIQWTPARKALHERILKGMLNPAAKTKPGEKPKVVFLTGPPGCLHADTPIFDPVDGTTATVHERWDSGGDFHVWALDPDGIPVIAEACRPWRYEPAEMIKLTFESGRTITVTPAHRFWDGSGYVAACTLLESGESRLPSISARDLSARTPDVPRWTRRLPGSTGRCSSGPGPCDGRPLAAAGIGRSPTPRPGDARGRSRRCSHGDGPGAGPGCNPPDHESDPHSRPDCIDRPGPRSGDGSSPRLAPGHVGFDGGWSGDASPRGQPTSPSHRAGPLPGNVPASMEIAGGGAELDTPDSRSGSAIPGIGPLRVSPRSPVGSSPRDDRGTLRRDSPSSVATLPVDISSCDKSLYKTDRIVKVESAGMSPYYDFHVPVLNNYWAAGFFHHNSGKTMAGQPEAAKLGVQFTTVNADDVKAKLPEYEGWNAGAVHEESSLLAEGPLTSRAIAERHHLLMDLTGGNTKKLQAMAEGMHAAGYEVHLVSIALPSFKSTGRAWDRFAKNAFGHADPTGKTRELGRFVPPAYVHSSIDSKPEATYQALKSQPYVKSHIAISTDVGKGEAPRVVDQGRR